MTDIPTSTNVLFVRQLVVPRCSVFDDASAQNTLGGDLDPKGTEIQPNLTSSLPYNLPR